MDLAVRRLVRISTLVVPLTLSGVVAAQNLIVGNEVTLSPFATGSNVVSATPVSLSSIATDQQNPSSPIGTRQASGQADGPRGILKASAEFNGVCCGFAPSAASLAAVGGVIKPMAPSTVPLGTVEDATFSFEFHGSFDASGVHDLDSLGGSMEVIRLFDSVVVPFWNPPYGILRPSLAFGGNAAAVTSTPFIGNPFYEHADVLSSDPGNLRGRLYFTIPFVVGESFRVTAQLGAGASLDPAITDSTGSFGAVDALNTGRLSITLPSGFSIESPDGLLSDAAGPVIAMVPEPGTWALLMTGVGLVAWRTRRSAGRRPRVRMKDE